ncbi:MAG TPA: amidase [Streptosporangiaceae bacterium]|nr:amidase [Streptosporangiaceae bacterium]
MVQIPSTDQLAGIAEHYGLGLSAKDVDEFAEHVSGLLSSWDAVERIYARSAPGPRADRTWHRPDDADNPLGAWYVRTDIRESDEGPLAGRTVAIKDNTMVAGVPMMNGSRTLEGFVPTRDATVVSRLLAAGATIAGKAVCEDLCFSGGSHTSRTGPVRNPWDLDRSAGGSSSGSAALVAAGEVDLATGGDQGGSVRIPSAFSGTVGHKPTHGLVPYTGAFPIEQTIDHIGPITRTVADAALMLEVMAGRDGLDPRQPADLTAGGYQAALGQGARGLRIGVVGEGFGIPELSVPGVDDAVRAAVDVLRSAGLAAEDVSVPWHTDAMHIWNVIATEGAAAQMVDANAYGMNWQGGYDPELIVFYGRQWRERSPEFSETVKLVLLAARHTIDTEYGRHYAMARNLAGELRKGYDDALATYDVLIMPTLPMTATEIPGADATRAELLGRSLEMIANTAPFDVTGHPATSVPCGLVDGLPAGMMIIGRHFDDATCLRVAHTFEQAVGGFPTPPVP